MIMSESIEMFNTLDMFYFNWLCSKVQPNSILDGRFTPSQFSWKLFRKLQNTEFVWLLSGDDNRVMDGMELRREFILEGDIPDNPEWRLQESCSVLEMLVAFARRAEFQTDIPVRDWFWEFLQNLRMDEFTDGYDPSEEEMEEILDKFIWRTYEYDGYGGMFPLHDPKRDQRKVEIWYQFCDYLMDQNRMP